MAKANELPHLEESSLTTYYPPKGEVVSFEDDTQYEEQVREWALVTTKEVKKEFWYKGKTYKRLVTIKGYEEYNEGTYKTAVIEFQDGHLSCIHPAYLKEMQDNKFTRSYEGLFDEESSDKPKKTKKAASKKSTEPKKEKLALPDDKVHFTAKVKEFTTKPNPFSDNDDEIVVYEEVILTGDVPLTIGEAWSSYSGGLKKAEIAVGDSIAFDAKITDKKKLNKEVLYKLNNPSKILKL